jgi:WD40 repeat protein
MTDIASLELSEHSSQITHALFDPTGKYAITTDKTNTICIWNSKTGALLQQLLQEASSIDNIDITKNGKILYTISRDNLVRIWHLGEDFNAIPKTICHSDDKYIIMVNVSFSPDGRYMLTASSDHAAKLWDLSDYSCKATLAGHSGGIYLTTFNNSGTQVATASDDKTIRIWQLDGLKLLEEIPFFHRACTLKFDKYNQPKITIKTALGIIKTWNSKEQKWVDPNQYCIIRRNTQLQQYTGNDEKIITLHANRFFTRLCTYANEDDDGGECKLWNPYTDSFLLINDAIIDHNNPFNQQGNRIIVIKKSDKTKAKILTDISHKRAISSLSLALHHRLGATSPAQILTRELFERIDKHLRKYSFL